jgi:hypothetical protein
MSVCDVRDATLTEVFPCFFLSCKANARVLLVKDGARPALSKLVNFLIVLCVSFFNVMYVSSLYSVYCV